MGFPFLLSLNTSTLRPYSLSVEEQITVTADGGFDGIELWLRDIRSYMEDGGDLAALRRLAEDAGIRVVNGIAFFKWADRDSSVRSAGLEDAEEEMSILAELGCSAVAAPPTGNVEGLSGEELAAHFDRLRERAKPIGVTPILEFWGRSNTLHSIDQALSVLKASREPGGSMLLDLFHMYTGGSSADDVSSLTADQIGLVHINDYPAEPPRETVKDVERVMPGDGIGPVSEFLRTLDRIGFSGPLSVELFRQDYGDPDAAATVRQAKEKTLGCWEESDE